MTQDYGQSLLNYHQACLRMMKNDLGTLQRYLEVSPEQKKQAVSVIGWN